MGKKSKTQLSPGASTKVNNLKRPDRIRTGEKPHKCQHCFYVARNNYSLKIHGRVHTGEKPFNCRYCPFKTAYKYGLKFHEHKHTGEKPFKCRHCPFKTAHKFSLKGHKQWHTGERPHKCPLCPFTTVRRTLLENHERMHTGEKPFTCRYCSFKSAYKNSLKIHERTHTGERPFKCQHCPYVATQSANLIIHKRKHSGERAFESQHCNYTSTHMSRLKTHLKYHTRGDLSKLEHPTKLRSTLAPKKPLQSGRKSLKCKIPPETTTVSSAKYAEITYSDSSRKQGNNVSSPLQDLLEGEDEFYCQDAQLDSWHDQEINESSSQGRFEMFICKECNYALLSEKELCIHYTVCHKLPVVNLNTRKTDWTIQQ